MLSKLGSRYAVRPANLEDAADYTALANAWALEREGVAVHDPDETKAEWQAPGLNLETDTRLVHDPDGRLVASAVVWDTSEPHVRTGGHFRVLPGCEDPALDEALLGWVEERAREAIPKAPADARVTLSSGAFSRDEARKRLLASHGFEMVRHFWRLRVEMEEAPSVLDLPDGISIRTVDPAADIEAIAETVRDAFRDHWGFVEGDLADDVAEWRHWVEGDPTFDPTTWFLACRGDEVIGVSIGTAKRPESDEMAYIFVLAVRPEWRGRGIARALLTHSFAVFYNRGKTMVDLDADSANLTGAIRLYEGVGMRPVWQNDAYEKELRPGIDLQQRGPQTN